MLTFFASSAKAFSYSYGSHLQPGGYSQQNSGSAGRKLSYGRLAYSYGQEISPITQSRPIEQLNIPDQGPGFIVPNGRTSFRSLATSYGEEIPTETLIPIAPLRPLEDLNIPETGPGFIIPERKISLTYGQEIPVAPIAPLRPLEDLDIPEGGPGFIIPERKVSLTYGQEIPVVPIAPLRPIEDLNLPEQGPGFIVPLGERSLDRGSPLLYQYEYQDINSAKQEARSENGVTQGFYAYVDPSGAVQRVEYVADDQNGYQVINMVHPEDSPDVAKAKVEFFRAYQQALEANAV